MKFKIDDRLSRDCIFCAQLQISDLYLMNDKKYPWFVLIPRCDNVFDITDLDIDRQIIALKEINIVSDFLKKKYNFDKLNVASLGNVVKQLHIHVVARFEDDPTFPEPIWCSNKAAPYQSEESEKLIAEFNDYYTKR